MIRGRIAIPDVDPKTWRSRGRKRKRAQPALASAIVTPAPMKKRQGPLTWLGDQVVAPDAALNALSTATKRSAIVSRSGSR
jgi:hypothetical protein